MQEALALVRNDLGPEAAVLHTRRVSGGMLRWFAGGKKVEVTASAGVNVPSRLPPNCREDEPHQAAARRTNAAAPVAREPAPDRIPPVDGQNFRSRLRDGLVDSSSDLQSMVEQLCESRAKRPDRELPESLFRLFTELLDAEVEEPMARELIERVHGDAAFSETTDLVMLKARISRMVEEEIRVCGPIETMPGKCRLVALVGPTGVGKTTTIAKLAANYRLREKRRVGLITVDTYRIAAVEQLRTYADIIDLPMEVVATPREMRQAVARMADLDLVLMDTAGRSPRDDVRIQELKSMLGEAGPDEVHLVLSSVSGTSALIKTAERFGPVGVTALLLTKLDEATGLGNLIPLLRSCKLPLGYTTNGQNVPDDIETADAQTLARVVLGMATEK